MKYLKLFEDIKVDYDDWDEENEISSIEDGATIRKRTNDEWYGNYDKDEVELKYHGDISYKTDPSFRVSVWGNDDYGMHRDFDTKSEAIEMFLKLKEYTVININDLYKLDFEVF